MTEDDRTMERMTIRVDREIVDQLDVILRGERRFSTRSDVIRAAIIEFIETRAKNATRVVTDLPAQDLNDLQAMVHTGVIISVGDGIRMAVTQWIEQKTLAMKQRTATLRKLGGQELENRLNEGWPGR